MEPGEDVGGLRERLAGYVVQRLCNIGSGQIVDGQRAGIGMMEFIWGVK